MVFHIGEEKVLHAEKKIKHMLNNVYIVLYHLKDLTPDLIEHCY